MCKHGAVRGLVEEVDAQPSCLSHKRCRAYLSSRSMRHVHRSDAPTHHIHRRMFLLRAHIAIVCVLLSEQTMRGDSAVSFLEAPFTIFCHGPATALRTTSSSIVW
eukprot:scaffold776_cov347-Pavlova_lutheri.AAC.48